MSNSGLKRFVEVAQSQRQASKIQRKDEGPVPPRASSFSKSPQEAMVLMTPGMHLPPLSAPAYVNGQILPSVSLSSLSNEGLNWTCLVFYAHDFDPKNGGSVISECYLSHRWFSFIGCSIVLCSTDSCYAHLAWMKALKALGTIAFYPVPDIPMLGDTSHVVARACGMLNTSEGVARTGLILVDPALSVHKVIVSDDIRAGLFTAKCYLTVTTRHGF
ncbi:thioredoxin peroxidase-like isoform X2 [Hyalella azteca]|uniref:thioredoxin-dependent peroxiredoxin n=1 Tax=Hyalella azteca TaxID=294128 RepID=A0A8B7NSA7_HYAAZ|nr:thioredoxin peroxidase-like isoform X2 [Hyalella azteca]